MLSLIAKANALFGRIPGDLIAIVARIGIATTFLRSGLLKLDGWSNGNTLALFTYEYKLPVIPPEIAAYMATAMELSMPVLILSGLPYPLCGAGPARHDARDRDFRLPERLRYPRRVGGGTALSHEIRCGHLVSGQFYSSRLAGQHSTKVEQGPM